MPGFRLCICFKQWYFPKHNYTQLYHSQYHYQILTLLSLSITVTVYITNNYTLGGAVWSRTSAPSSVGWTSVASDKSGKRLAAAQGSCCAGFIYTSTNG